MKVEQLVVGQLQSNCFLVWDKDKKTIIIDPADAGDYIIRRIQDLKLKPKLVVATHGHFDHVLAVPEVKLTFKIPFLMHQADLFLLNRSQETAHFFTKGEADPPLMPDRFIKEGEIIKAGKIKLRVIECPGHSPGGVSLYSREEGILFAGDTLFRRGIGRYDFSYASKKDLFNSIKKLLKLPEDTLVYPGHGPETTVGEEKGMLNVLPFY